MKHGQQHKTLTLCTHEDLSQICLLYFGGLRLLSVLKKHDPRCCIHLSIDDVTLPPYLLQLTTPVCIYEISGITTLTANFKVLAMSPLIEIFSNVTASPVREDVLM